MRRNVIVLALVALMLVLSVPAVAQSPPGMPPLLEAGQQVPYDCPFVLGCELHLYNGNVCTEVVWVDDSIPIEVPSGFIVTFVLHGTGHFCTHCESWSMGYPCEPTIGYWYGPDEVGTIWIDLSKQTHSRSSAVTATR